MHAALEGVSSLIWTVAAPAELSNAVSMIVVLWSSPSVYIALMAFATAWTYQKALLIVPIHVLLL